MIEDPKLTLRILQYFARDDVGYPANMTVQRHLRKEFPEVRVDKLQYHVVCAFENDLLQGDYERNVMFEGVSLNTGYIDGLTARGGDYVRDAGTKFWQDAWDKIEEAGIVVTTGLLVDVVAKLVRTAVS